MLENDDWFHKKKIEQFWWKLKEYKHLCQSEKVVHTPGNRGLKISINHFSINEFSFQRDGTEQLFGAKGQKFLHCPWTKGQRCRLKILPRDGMGRESLSKSGTGRGTITTFLSKSGMAQGRDGRITICFLVSEHLFLFQSVLFLF